MIPKAAVHLARLFILRKRQSAAAIALDGYDRWGNGSDYAGKEADEALAWGGAKTGRAITKRIKELRLRDPEALEYFVASQITLLDHVIAHDKDSTAVFVAKGERANWEEVRAGTRGAVRSNAHYIHEDVALFTSLFGFSPRVPLAELTDPDTPEG